MYTTILNIFLKALSIDYGAVYSTKVGLDLNGLATVQHRCCYENSTSFAVEIGDNDGSFSRFSGEEASPDHHVIEMSQSSSTSGGVTWTNVESIKDELKELERLNDDLSSSHERSKTLHNAKAVKELRAKMDADRLTAPTPLTGVYLAVDRGTSVVNGLRKKLKDSMESFNGLREKISSEYRETVQRRYFTLRENPDGETLDLLISTVSFIFFFSISRESESFLQKAIQEQGRGRILDTINEIQEGMMLLRIWRRISRNCIKFSWTWRCWFRLKESNWMISRAIGGTERLQTARNYQKNTRKWTCYAIILLLVIVLFVVLFTVRPWEKMAVVVAVVTIIQHQPHQLHLLLELRLTC
ncbi:hypothetical protein CXB51_003221 [Gossypium anomalum]|uniref:Syntaxin N-terminal domain-containing protein n=1 Tax=Gossypium anomalum TaxID=47600 RepID=A0A8J5ZIL5_9ROSI|nr:hypothetical protein CXB51_003221 [Gossypium anomalum]